LVNHPQCELTADHPTMVLLHALGKRGSDWAPVVDRFLESFQVVTLDLRGHGDSDRPHEYSFGVMCDDVIGVLDQLQLESVILVGHSMGGVIVFLVAIDRPDLVKRLIVEDVSPPYERDQPIPVRAPNAQALDFDFAAVQAIVGEVNAGSPATWEGLASISAPTLLIGGGSDSHIPQDKLEEVALRIPCCDMVTIAVGHHVHAAAPGGFAETILDWLEA